MEFHFDLIYTIYTPLSKEFILIFLIAIYSIFIQPIFNYIGVDKQMQLQSFLNL